MKATIESLLTLEAVTEHFAQWRRSKKNGERIPEVLWSKAIALVGQPDSRADRIRPIPRPLSSIRLPLIL